MKTEPGKAKAGTSAAIPRQTCKALQRYRQNKNDDRSVNKMK